jgi:WD40 repeat protein
MWNLRSGHLVASWKGHTDWVDGLAFLPNGEGLISFGMWDKALKYWDISGSTSGAVVGPEQKKTNLSFIGHTVCPSLFLFF